MRRLIPPDTSGESFEITFESVEIRPIRGGWVAVGVDAREPRSGILSADYRFDALGFRLVRVSAQQ
jgi:hypothetical protein